MNSKTAAALRKRQNFKLVFAALSLGHASRHAIALFYGVSPHFVNRVEQLRAWEKMKMANA